MDRGARIHKILAEGLKAARVEVVDESHRHAGHAGARPEGETHYRVTVVAHVFDGRSRIQCHRMVYDLLTAEIEGGLHALALTALTPAAESG